MQGGTNSNRAYRRGILTGAAISSVLIQRSSAQPGVDRRSLRRVRRNTLLVIRVFFAERCVQC